MVALAWPLEATPILAQNFLSSGAKSAKESGDFALSNCETLTDDLEGHIGTVRHAVCVEKLRDHRLELFDERVHVLRFGGEAWYIIARSDPDPRLLIPDGMYGKVM